MTSTAPYFISVSKDQDKRTLDYHCDEETGPLEAEVWDVGMRPTPNGEIYCAFDKAASTATLNPSGKQQVKVTNGKAQFTFKAGMPLNGAEFGTAVIQAYPIELDGTDLSKADANRVATYNNLRIWARASAQIIIENGDGQSTDPDTRFNERLQVKVLDSNGAPVPDTELALLLEGGDAFFDFGEEHTGTNIMGSGRTDDKGLYTLPPVIAGQIPNTSISIHVVSNIAAMVSFNLKVNHWPISTEPKYEFYYPDPGISVVSANITGKLYFTLREIATRNPVENPTEVLFSIDNSGGTQLKFYPQADTFDRELTYITTGNVYTRIASGMERPGAKATLTVSTLKVKEEGDTIPLQISIVIREA